MRRGDVSHCARYSPEVIEAFTPILSGCPGVFDPFAGPGDRLGELCDRLGIEVAGIEIEPEFIVDERVRAGDATNDSDYPWVGEFWIVTSPAYPNGMSDHFAAADTSKRNTYRAHLARTTGADRPLAHNNQGRWGYRGRGPQSGARREYWRIANEAVKCWRHADRALVNVKDFISTRDEVTLIEPVVAQWRDVLENHGWLITDQIEVPTPGLRFGANAEVRIDHEVIIVADQAQGRLL